MIPEELQKRLDEAAVQYCKDYGRTGVINGCDISAFKHGAEYMFKEAIKAAKEWMKEELYNCPIWNEPRSRSYFTVQDLIEHLEADMNKLWEGEK